MNYSFSVAAILASEVHLKEHTEFDKAAVAKIASRPPQVNMYLYIFFKCKWSKCNHNITYLRYILFYLGL